MLLLIVLSLLGGRGVGPETALLGLCCAVSGVWCEPLLLSEAVVSFCFWATQHDNVDWKEAADC